MAKERRLSNIFSHDGKSITLALDGYYFSTKTSGIDQTIALLSKMVDNGLDAVIVTYGMAKLYAKELSNVGLIVRADLSTNIFDPSVPNTSEILSVKDAVRLGADAIVSMTFPGSKNEANSHRIAWNIAREADYWNIPFMCETLPYSYHVTTEESNRLEELAAAARIGTELGADIIKTRLTGHSGDKDIIELANKPLLVLGGPETTDMYSYFQYVQHCMDMGAKGVAVGRKITLSSNPVGVVAGLNVLIHKNGTAEAAYQAYQSLIEKIAQ